jgi:hypothetical protein
MAKKQLSKEQAMQFDAYMTSQFSGIPKEESSPVAADSFAAYAETQAKPPKEVPWYRSIPSAALKGLIEGTVALGEIMGPTQETYQGQRQREKLQRDEALKQLLPTEEGFIEGAAQRIGRNAPFFMTGAGSALGNAVRSGAAGLLGQTAEEFGAPEWAQAAAEIAPGIAPALGKKIIPSGSQKQMLEEARKIGLSEEAIAPLLQSEKKLATLSPIAAKGARSEAALERTKSEIGSVFEELKQRPESRVVLAQPQSDALVSKLQSTLEKMPDAVRRLVKQDFLDFSRKPVSGEEIMNFWADINHHIQGNPQLGILKEPLQKALTTINPALGHDFEVANKLYSAYSKSASKLKPSFWEKGIKVGEGIGLVKGIMTGDFSLISSVVGMEAARRLATESLLNPRMQNLTAQMAQALSKNKAAVADRLWDRMASEVGKKSPRAAAEMSKADIMELFSNQEEMD